MHSQLHNKSRCQSIPQELQDTRGNCMTCTHEASVTLVLWEKNRWKQEARERSRNKESQLVKA